MSSLVGDKYFYKLVNKTQIESEFVLCKKQIKYNFVKEISENYAQL